MHYHRILLLMLASSTLLQAHVNTPRRFYNDVDKKVRVTLWYKRYKHVKDGIRYEKKMRRYTTYVKPGRMAEITLRATHFEDLEFCYFMVTNTRRRNEWAALTYNDLQTTNDFTILYDDAHKLAINLGSRNIS